MKQYSMYLNIILLIAVSFLYYLHFTSNIHSTLPTKDLKLGINHSKVDSGDINIAFINTDSLWENYDYINKLKDQLETKKNRMERNIQNKITSFQTKVDRYQKQASSGLIGQDQAQAKEQELMFEQQQIIALKDSLENEFLREESKLNGIIQDSIVNFIKRNNSHYNFIFGYSKGSSLLFADDVFDITQNIVSGLNNEYKLSEKK